MPFPNVPEEIVERILAACVIPNTSAKPSWHTQTPLSDADAKPRSRTSPLLVNQSWLRIGTPLFYHTIHLASAEQTTRLCKTITSNPYLAANVRTIVAYGIWPELNTLFRYCPRIEKLDVTVNGLTCGAAPEDVAAVEQQVASFGDGISNLDLRHLVVRKPKTSTKMWRAVFLALAKGIDSWSSLRHAQIAFRLSDDSITSPLITALSNSPSLTSLQTQVSATWNAALLKISANPSLERISLCTLPSFTPEDDTTPTPILPTGLFFHESKKCERLSELINIGTQFIRSKTISLPGGARGPHAPVSSSPTVEEQVEPALLSRQASREDVKSIVVTHTQAAPLQRQMSI